MGNTCPSQCCQAEISRSINNLAMEDIEELKKRAPALVEEVYKSKEKNKKMTARKSLDFKSSHDSKKKDEISVQHRESLSKKSSPFETYSDKYSVRHMESRPSGKGSLKSSKKSSRKDNKRKGLASVDRSKDEEKTVAILGKGKIEEESSASFSVQKENLR